MGLSSWDLCSCFYCWPSYVCKSLRSTCYDILNRRSQFPLLLETILELAVHSGIVNEKDVSRARDVLRRVRDEIGKTQAKGRPSR
ncbi:unnamed protein product [Meloidogyne enterolobii]